jgi:hypothetical protein
MVSTAFTFREGSFTLSWDSITSCAFPGNDKLDSQKLVLRQVFDVSEIKEAEVIMNKLHLWLILGLGSMVVGLIAVGAAIAVVGFPSSAVSTPSPQATVTPVVPSDTPYPTSSISGIVWHDVCDSQTASLTPSDIPEGCLRAQDEIGLRANGVFDPGEEGITGVDVRLGLGSCPSLGFKSTQTDVSGSYQFFDLIADDYCISIDANSQTDDTILSVGSWTVPVIQRAQAAIGVTVAAGEKHTDIDFAWDYHLLPPRAPTPTALSSSATPTPPACIDRATFVQDMTIADNTPITAGNAFEKVWRLRNAGTCTWNPSYSLSFTSGHSMGAPAAVPLPGTVAPGSTVDLRVKLVAPTNIGTYRGNWHLKNPGGILFGIGEKADKPFWVQIIVGPLNAGGAISWRAEYFANRSPKGTPALVRYDSVIDFNWKRDAPASVIPADDFSVRWTGKAEFAGGTYRFLVLMDDGARLWVDDQLVIDAWKDGSAREISTDVALIKGTHNLRLEYYEHTRDARIRLKWEKVDAPTFPDWKGEYWADRELKGSPDLVRNDKDIQFQWESKSPAAGLPVENFSARWTRKLSFETGSYILKARADDGIRIFLDGKLILNEWHSSDGSKTYSVKKSLSGKHTLVIEYYERTGKAMIKVWWERIEPAPTVTPTVTPTPTPTDEPAPAPKAIYSFVDKLCDAEWRNSAGPLSCPGEVDDQQGSVTLPTAFTREDGVLANGPAFLLQPETVDFGWIRGTYPSFEVQSGDRLRATVGCLENQTACAVTIELKFRLLNTPDHALAAWSEKYDGQVNTIDIDLTPLAGQVVTFTIEAYAEKASAHNKIFWLSPAIWRQIGNNQAGRLADQLTRTTLSSESSRSPA